MDTGHAVINKIWTFAIFWLLFPEDALTDTISDYQTPKDCQGLYTSDFSGVSLACNVPAIKYLNFSVIPSKFTQELVMTCTSPYIESTLENVDLRHLNELRQLAFEGCHFSNLTSKSGLSDVHQMLESLEIRCDNNPANNLRIQKSSISGLTKLHQMGLTRCEIDSVPELEFCSLSNLNLLVLSSNNIADIEDIGFSNCTAQHHPACNVSSLKVLELSYNKIGELPENSLCFAQNLLGVSFRGNLIESVSDVAFSAIGPSLLILDLSWNNLTSLPMLHQLGALNHLNVSHNSIEELRPVVSKGLATFDASFNDLKVIKNSTFNDLTKLTSLNMSHNQISSIEANAFVDLSQLLELILGHNQIATITSEILRGVAILKRLILNDNLISQMASTVITNCCPRLTECELSDNKLSTLRNLSRLHELEIFNMANNQLTNITQDAFAGAFQLQGISLKENSITEVHPRAFYNLSQLILINLSLNNISEIHPTAFFENPNLTYLDLRGNQLAQLPVLDRNTHLIYIRISENKLTHMDYGVLPTSVRILDASHNLIRSLETKFYTARKLTNLTVVNLAYNKLTTIGEASLPPMSKHIDLSWNQISRIISGTFQQMRNLQSVNLEANNITEVMHGFLRVDTPKGESPPQFLLSGNPLECNCMMQWLPLNNIYDQRYGKINDFSFLHCWVRRMGSPNRIIKLVQDVTPDEFLCQFTIHEFSPPLCDDEPKGYCNVTCPTDCTCYRNYVWSNITVYCKSAGLKAIPSGLSLRTTTLYLDGNSLSNLDDTSFDANQTNLITLFLNNSHITRIGDETFNAMAKLQTLHLQSNGLKVLGKSAFSGLVSLQKLYLFNNNLQLLDASVFQPLKSLSLLQLQNNELVDFPVWTFKQIPSLNSLSINGNPWRCDCGQLEQYREWLQNYPDRVTHKEQLTCNLSDFHVKNSSAVLMVYFNSSECLNATTDIVHENHLTAIVSISGAFVIVALIVVLVFVYRYELQVLIFSRYGLRLFHNNVEVDDDKKIFDAFISYCNQDEVFVATQIVPQLEGIKDPYKLCLHERNFAVGAQITRSIMEAVKYSRRTVVILSQNFIKSQWCGFEFKMAHLQMLNDHCNRLIIVVYGDLPDKIDPEINLYLRTNTYLKWGDQLFWKKLYFALPNKQQRPPLMQ